MSKSNSVFFRVYAILLGTIVATALFAAFAFAVQFRARAAQEPTARVYSRTGDGKVASSSSDADFLALADAIDKEGKTGIGKKEGVPYAAMRPDGYFFLVYGSPLVNPRRLAAFGLVALIVMAGVAAAAYQAIRSVLSPLRSLGEGVAAVRAGKYDYRVPEEGSDEFAALSASFNALSDRIRYQLEMKEQLLLDVSHELRSPLTRLAVSAEFVADEDLKASMREDIIELEKKIRRLLLSSRLDTPYGVPRFENLDAVRFLETVAAKFIAEKPPISIEESESPITVFADPELLETVLRNLLENALRYSGGQELPVVARAENTADGVVLSVRDHGPGIDAASVLKLFEPFYRADASRSAASGGFGIGLYLCKRIMDAHGGEITLSNAEGGGTLAVLRFPSAPTGSM